MPQFHLPQFHLPILVLALGVPAGMPLASAADSAGGVYRIDSAVIAGGGASLAGGAFQLSGTVGQVAASTLVGSTYSVHDGFWAPTGPQADLIFANGFES